jgi:hypothetical protein
VQPTLRSGSSADPGRPSFQDALQSQVPPKKPDARLDLVSDDSASGLSDPDRDAWTQQIIGRRIHWQYGPDGKRRPFFRQRTDTPDSRGESSNS